MKKRGAFYYVRQRLLIHATIIGNVLICFEEKYFLVSDKNPISVCFFFSNGFEKTLSDETRTFFHTTLFYGKPSQSHTVSLSLLGGLKSMVDNAFTEGTLTFRQADTRLK